MVAIGLGWLLSEVINDHHQQVLEPSRVEVDRQVQELLKKRTQQPLSPADERRLMERLLALGRLPESIVLVQDQIKAHPKVWRWRLLLTQLHLRNGNNSAADAQIQLLTRLHPHQDDVLQTLAQLRLAQGRIEDAKTHLQTAFNASPANKRMNIGLLLADLQRQSGDGAAALNTYQQLSGQDPKDARPVMAQALLLQEQGKKKQAIDLLMLARQRQVAANLEPQAIDSLAALWGLNTNRTSAGGPAPTAAVPEPMSERPIP